MLVPYVVFVLVVASRAEIKAAAVRAVIACNALWAVASFVILADGPISPNLLGTAFLVGQALAVAALGVLQCAALRRPQAAIA